jgi:LAS superfamily LD-carboxypeptidase LdcB
MTTNLYKKLDGVPAAVAGGLVLIVIAYFGFTTYRNLHAERVELLARLETAQTENYDLRKIVREREGVINEFQGQIENISGTVGNLTKLAQTDEELLKKYSKVYFLNENYIPSRLAEIDKMYLVQTTSNDQIHEQVEPYLEDLLREANQDGIKLRIASAYRSFATQAALKSAYKVTYGSGANAFSADQGYSEHQLGTAVDFTTEKLGANFSLFGNDPAYKWLQQNAHKYGFILSYPSGNAYYKFEPWHWRYVGVDLATHLHEDGKYFYDLDQRQIDEYLIKLFD